MKRDAKPGPQAALLFVRPSTPRTAGTLRPGSYSSIGPLSDPRLNYNTLSVRCQLFLKNIIKKGFNILGERKQTIFIKKPPFRLFDEQRRAGADDKRRLDEREHRRREQQSQKRSDAERQRRDAQYLRGLPHYVPLPFCCIIFITPESVEYIFEQKTY